MLEWGVRIDFCRISSSLTTNSWWLRELEQIQIIFAYIFCVKQPRWRNRLARCTYNAEVVSSSLTRGTVILTTSALFYITMGVLKLLLSFSILITLIESITYIQLKSNFYRNSFDMKH